MENLNITEKLSDGTQTELRISDVKQHCISFAEWCVKENFTYYFNGKEWTWGHARRQEYYTSEELYDKWLSNFA